MNVSELFDLSGKVALVSGGATGIGNMASRALLAAGANVFLFSRKEGACAAVADDLNTEGHAGQATGFVGNVGTEEGLDAVLSKIKERTDRLNILVNNAGVTWGSPLGSFPYSAWDKVMSVNVAGLFHLTQGLLPMLERTGTKTDPSRVINIGSVTGEREMGDQAYSYASSKAAVHHLTRILGKELADRAITVNALAPGPFVSRMTAFATSTDDDCDMVARQVPLGRVGTDTDIAGSVLFLAGRGGAYVTGAIIPVSGGINVMSGPSLFEHAMG
ncbi:MAG: SDR family oxidoreductase [Pseudomonadota bacterium]